MGESWRCLLVEEEGDSLMLFSWSFGAKWCKERGRGVSISLRVFGAEAKVWGCGGGGVIYRRGVRIS